MKISSYLNKEFPIKFWKSSGLIRIRLGRGLHSLSALVVSKLFEIIHNRIKIATWNNKYSRDILYTLYTPDKNQLDSVNSLLPGNIQKVNWLCKQCPNSMTSSSH